MPTQQTLLPHRPLILAIAGCSGSGKTTLARELASLLNATLLPLDFYYHDLSHLAPEARAHTNFDHPDSLELSLLLQHLRELSAGRPIERPIYDFNTHTRVHNQTDTVHPAPVVIVEGILALHYAALLPLYTLSVYVDAPHDVCLTRRIHRDIRERGRTEQSVREQYEAAVRPMADQYILPSQAHATLTVSGCEALDWSVESTLRALRQRNLLHN